MQSATGDRMEEKNIEQMFSQEKSPNHTLTIKLLIACIQVLVKFDTLAKFDALLGIFSVSDCHN